MLDLKPDLDITWHEWSRRTHSFTGLLKLNYTDGTYRVAWIENDLLHKELGLAKAYGPISSFPYATSDYYLEGKQYTPRQYWGVMYEKYKGTEHEALCLIELLGTQQW